MPDECPPPISRKKKASRSATRLRWFERLIDRCDIKIDVAACIRWSLIGGAALVASFRVDSGDAAAAATAIQKLKDQSARIVTKVGGQSCHGRLR